MTNPTTSAGPNKLLIALIAVGGVLLLTVVAVIFLLIGQSTGDDRTTSSDTKPQPSSSPSLTTPSAEPIEEPTDKPADDQPSDTSVRFTSFTADPNVACDPTGEDEKPSPSISWSSVNAVAVYWTPNNREANGENGYSVGASGDQDDMSASKGEGERYEFPCNHEQTFDTTITLVGADGSKVSKHVTFTDINWGS